ncbi:hypothetical protein, partial [Mobilicoccus sp.]|uniref:hypothetical protein n=1 Tax=Mobilicoccus sp. TaxID=2034349 RepID=UPI00289F90E8
KSKPTTHRATGPNEGGGPRRPDVVEGSEERAQFIDGGRQLGDVVTLAHVVAACHVPSVPHSLALSVASE